MKKKKIKYDNVIIFGLIGLLVLLLLITGILIFGIYKDTFGSKADGVEIIDTIDVYGYQLTENNTDYYKDLFNELKELLSNEDYSDKEYAELVAKMFVADFYDLNSKLNKNDVGGYQFVYEGYQETFKKFASDVNGVYYYVDSNVGWFYLDNDNNVNKINVNNWKWLLSDLPNFYINVPLTEA